MWHPYAIRTRGTQDWHLHLLELIRIKNFLKLCVLNQILSRRNKKCIKDRWLAINLPKLFQIKSLKKVPMPKVYWGSTVSLTQKKSIVLIFIFPQHWENALIIDYWWFLYGFCQCLSLPYFFDADGDRISLETWWRINHVNQLRLLPMSMGHRRLTISVIVCPLYLLAFFRCRTQARQLQC